MDWCSTLIGGLIGFISSVGTLIVERLLNQNAKINLYAKIVYEHRYGKNTWGFWNFEDEIALNVPIWIEFQNLSNSTRVMRNVNLLLYKDGNRQQELCQINRSGDREKKFDFANDGSYSFVIEPRSIQKYECHFSLKQSMCKAECFYEIKLRYFDEKDKEHILHLGSVNGSWEVGDFPRSGEWIKLKK